jgi:hypothetical protein
VCGAGRPDGAQVRGIDNLQVYISSGSQGNSVTTYPIIPVLIINW